MKSGTGRLLLILSVAFAVLAFGSCLLIGLVVMVDRKKQPPAKPIPWGEFYEVDGLRVKVESASRGQFSGRSPSGTEIVSGNTAYIVRLKIENTDPTRNRVAGGNADAARLRDTLGNTYTTMGLKTDFGFKCTIDGQITPAFNKGAEVRSDTPVSDVLPFDVPVPAAKDLTLELDAGKYGGYGRIYFEIPFDRKQ